MTSFDIAGAAVEMSLVSGDQLRKTAAALVETSLRQTGRPAGKSLPQQRQQPATEELTEAVRNIMEHVQSISRQLSFTIDGETGSTVVTVVDRETEQVIRQIPSEEALAIARFIAAQLDGPVKGLLVQNEA